ncbi:MAG: Vps62-related protein [Labilithrix sp.]|nr:Vps62-related protein [Labilithrix sp.]MCW5809907.1 Vps62-related protein [Labilithrix sp.]
MATVRAMAAMISLGVAACAADAGDEGPGSLSDATEIEDIEGANEDADDDVVADSAFDVDPDVQMSALAKSPDNDAVTPAATQDQLIKTFAPHLHLHADDPYRPSSVDWYLARVTMRYNHKNCPDHEIYPVGKVTQQKLVAATHEDNGSFCRHDGGKKVAATTHEGFFLEIVNEATRKGSPRSDWKSYAVWRPQASGLVNIEYWIFYPYNDGFSIFNHESDWEHVRVTIDPKANGGQGKATEVKLSAHKGGTIVKANDPKLSWDGTHPVAYVAKGTHANYLAPGTYAIEGTHGIAKDTTKAAAAAAVWKTENAVVNIGTRAKPKNGQVFVKFWGRWGEINDIPETNGITRRFP